MKVYPPIDLEDRIAMQTESGREMLRVLAEVRGRMTGPERVAKAFELTESTRQTMREGIRRRHPEATEAELKRMFADALLGCHGMTLDGVQRLHREELARRARTVRTPPP